MFIRYITDQGHCWHLSTYQLNTEDHTVSAVVVFLFVSNMKYNFYFGIYSQMMKMNKIFYLKILSSYIPYKKVTL